MNNNRGNNNNNRRRGRTNNRPQGGGGGQQLNRIDSRARGNAPQMLEKYRKQAQDAHLNGDRVQAEYYLQFADHYFRVIADSRVRPDDQRPRPAGEPGSDRWSEGESEDETMEYGMDADFAGFDRQGRRDERDAPRENTQRENTQRESTQRDIPPRESQQRNTSQRENMPRDNQRDASKETGRDSARDSNRDSGRDGRDRDGEVRERDGRDRPASEPRENRDSRPPREPREAREPREPRDQREDRRPRSEPVVAQEAPVEIIRAAEGEPMGETDENPFVREQRGPRGLRPRRDGRAPREAEAAPPVSLAAGLTAGLTAGLDPSILPPAIGIRSEPEIEMEVLIDAPGEMEDAPAPKRRGRPRKNPLPEASVPAEG